MTFIYYDGNFYYESGSDLSNLTDEQGFKSDWGKVKIACSKGEVHIRPATPEEMEKHYKKLQAIKERK